MASNIELAKELVENNIKIKELESKNGDKQTVRLETALILQREKIKNYENQIKGGTEKTVKIDETAKQTVSDLLDEMGV